MARIIVGRKKKYVAVDVRFEPDGHLRPLAIVFGPDQVYTIDKIKDVSRRAAEVGGVGDRYLCLVNGQETNPMAGKRQMVCRSENYCEVIVLRMVEKKCIVSQ